MHLTGHGTGLDRWTDRSPGLSDQGVGRWMSRGRASPVSRRSEPGNCRGPGSSLYDVAVAGWFSLGVGTRSRKGGSKHEVSRRTGGHGVTSLEGPPEQLVVHGVSPLQRILCSSSWLDFTLSKGARVRQGRPCRVPVPLQPKLLAEHEPSVLIQTLNPLSTHPSCSRRQGTTQAKDKGTFVGWTPVPNLGQLFDQEESPHLPAMARFSPAQATCIPQPLWGMHAC